MKRSKGPCGQNCNCPGDPGCPDAGRLRTYRRGALAGNDITKTGVMKRYHVKGGMPGSLGDFDVNACIEAGGSVQSCQQAAITQMPGYVPPSSTTPTNPAAPGANTGSFWSAFGSGVASIFAPKPGMYPYPMPQSGMSDTTKVLLAGGAALAIVMLVRR